MKRKRKTLSVEQDDAPRPSECHRSSGTHAKVRAGGKANAEDTVPENTKACARTRSGRISGGAANAKEVADPKNNMTDGLSQEKTGQKRGKGTVQSPTRVSPRLRKVDTENASKQVPDDRLQAKTGKKQGKATVESPTRNSPRPRTGDRENASKKIPESKRRRIAKHRESQSKPDDGSENEDQPHKKSIYQCSPFALWDALLKHVKKVPNLVKRIKRIQYHTLFGIQPVKPKKRVIEYLINCFDEESDMFVIDGQPIDIRPLIQKVLGLPNSGLEVIVDKKYKKQSELRDLLTVQSGDDKRSVYAAHLLELMSKEELDERTYCILFILQSCAHYLAPRANRILEREFLSIFKNVSLDQIKNMKWCDFFANFLIDGIKKYKRNKSLNRKCYGCVHILAVIFFDFVTPDAEITKGFPRINYVTQADLDTLASGDLDKLSKNVKPLDQTVYKEDYRVEELDESEVLRPELTDHRNDTVADASMNNQPSLHLLQGQLLLRRVSDLELKVSVVPEEEKMIKHLKDDLARLEDHLNANRESITNEIKQLKKLLANYLRAVELSDGKPKSSNESRHNMTNTSGITHEREVVNITGDSSAQCSRKIPTRLKYPIPEGERFLNPDHQGNAEIHTKPNRLKPEDIYQHHVIGSINKADAPNTQILIKDVLATVGEFARNLSPKSEIDGSFMWLCSTAMMIDWDQPKRFILNPLALIKAHGPGSDLKDLTDCINHIQVADPETLYLPLLKHNHWTLAILYLYEPRIEIYDSLFSWEALPDFLVELISNIRDVAAATKNIVIPDANHFDVTYPDFPKQRNIYDCGLFVIKALECHNGREPVKIEMDDMNPYRIELAYRLYYHQWNDYNPVRELVSEN